MRKKWYEIIDFYRLTGLVLIWVSSWILMIPWKADITSPYFNNIWGALFALFGAVAEKTVKTQQSPDLLCGLLGLLLMTILQFRGIINITGSQKLSETDSKRNKCLIVCMNLLSIIVHTLFFTLLIKIFIFPDKGASSMLERLQQNLIITLFAAVCIAGMIFGAVSLSKIFLIIFSLAAMFFNINFVSSVMGVWGFIAILFSISGFYLEFCFKSFNRDHLLIDLAFLLGHYDKLELKKD